MAAPNWKPPKPVKDKKYLSWLITLPCCRCGREGWEDENGRRQGIVYHHQPRKGGAAMGSKREDRRAVPLCCNTLRGKGCHETYGEVGRETFWGEYDVEGLISRLNRVYEMTKGGGR